jgi:hypothetical protein
MLITRASFTPFLIITTQRYQSNKKERLREDNNQKFAITALLVPNAEHIREVSHDLVAGSGDDLYSEEESERGRVPDNDTAELLERGQSHLLHYLSI